MTRRVTCSPRNRLVHYQRWICSYKTLKVTCNCSSTVDTTFRHWRSFTLHRSFPAVPWNHARFPNWRLLTCIAQGSNCVPATTSSSTAFRHHRKSCRLSNPPQNKRAAYLFVTLRILAINKGRLLVSVKEMSSPWWTESSLLEPSSEDELDLALSREEVYFQSRAGTGDVASLVDDLFSPVGFMDPSVAALDSSLHEDYGQQGDVLYDESAFQPELTSYEGAPQSDYGWDTFALRDQLRSAQVLKTPRLKRRSTATAGTGRRKSPTSVAAAETLISMDAAPIYSPMLTGIGEEAVPVIGEFAGIEPNRSIRFTAAPPPSPDPESMKTYRQEAIRRHREKMRRLREMNPSAFTPDDQGSRRAAVAARTRDTGRFAREGQPPTKRTRSTKKTTSTRKG